MYRRLRAGIVVAGFAVAAVGCATSQEWADWSSHPTHYASGEHLWFSWRNNRDGSNPRVTRRDVDASRAEKWWGNVVTVRPDQIFQN